MTCMTSGQLGGDRPKKLMQSDVRTVFGSSFCFVPCASSSGRLLDGGDATFNYYHCSSMFLVSTSQFQAPQFPDETKYKTTSYGYSAPFHLVSSMVNLRTTSCLLSSLHNSSPRYIVKHLQKSPALSHQEIKNKETRSIWKCVLEMKKIF